MMTVPETGKWEGMSSDNFSDTPIPLVKPLPEATELPFADLGPLKEPISAIADLTQAPNALALQGALAAISVSAQAHANVETLLRPVPLSLFFFSIAESSARKSGVDSLATEAIREHEKPLLEKFDRDEERWNAAEKLCANNRSTFSVIDDDEDTDLDVPLAQPINPRILFDDPTYEGLVRYLEFSQPSIGLISDEGGKVVGGYSMSPQNQVATAAAYSSLWDGRDINKIRAGSSSISLANRRMSLHLSMQPKIAETLFANEQIRDQGILSRVLVVQPDSLKGTRFLVEDEDHFNKVRRAEDALACFNNRLRALLEIKPKVNKHDPQELAPPTLTV